MKSGRIIVGLLVLYVIAIFGSETFNGWSWGNEPQELGKPFLLGAYVVTGFSFFTRTRGRLWIWLLCCAIGYTSQLWYISDYVVTDTAYNEFVYRYEPIILSWLAVVLYGWGNRNAKLTASLLVVSGVVLIFFTTRNTVGCLLVTAIFVMLRGRVARTGIEAFREIQRLFKKAVLVGLVGSGVVYGAYVYCAPKGSSESYSVRSLSRNHSLSSGFRQLDF